MTKKLVGVLVSIMLGAGLLAGCGASGEQPARNGESQAVVESSQPVAESSQEEVTADPGYVYSANGVDVAVNGLMTPIVETLGEPDKYFESESCAFQGLDKVYTYGSVVISTYPEEGVDYVFTIELKDDTITTAEGIYIGSTKDDVIAAYGTATSETDVALIYEKGDCQLTFFFEENYVTNITYSAIVE